MHENFDQVDERKKQLKSIAVKIVDLLRKEDLKIWEAKETLHYADLALDHEKLK